MEDSKQARPAFTGLQRQISRLRTLAAWMVLLSAGLWLITQRIGVSAGTGVATDGSLFAGWRAEGGEWHFILIGGEPDDTIYVGPSLGFFAANTDRDFATWPYFEASSDGMYSRELFLPQWFVVAMCILSWGMLNLLNRRYVPASGVRRVIGRLKGLCRAKPRLWVPLLTIVIGSTAVAFWKYDRLLHDRAGISRALSDFASGRDVVATTTNLESYPDGLVEEQLKFVLHDTSRWSLISRTGRRRIRYLAYKHRIPLQALRFACLAQHVEQNTPSVRLNADALVAKQIDVMKADAAIPGGFDELSQRHEEDPDLQRFLMSTKERLEKVQSVTSD